MLLLRKSANSLKKFPELPLPHSKSYFISPLITTTYLLSNCLGLLFLRNIQSVNIYFLTKAKENSSVKIHFPNIESKSLSLRGTFSPLQIIKDGGLDPLKDIKQHVVSKQIAWAALKRGDVDALGFSYDRFIQYLNEDQIPVSDYRVLAKSAELPNDLLIGGAHVPEAVKSSIKNAFVKGSDLLLAQLLKGERNNKYENMHFLPNVSDENYNLVRKMYITAGYPEFG